MHGTEVVFFIDVVRGPPQAQQPLCAFVADRNHQPAADRELLTQRRGYARAARCDDDRVERRDGRPALGAIAAMHLYVAVAEPVQPRARRIAQARLALDREDFGGELGKYCCRIARSGPDFEHAVRCVDLERINHQRNDIWLGNRLVFLNG